MRGVRTYFQDSIDYEGGLLIGVVWDRGEEDYKEIHLQPENKTLILKVQGYAGAWFSKGHAYASLYLKGDRPYAPTAKITLGWELNQETIDKEPGVWESYKAGDRTSRFISEDQARGEALRWFCETFPEGSDWILAEEVWETTEDDQGVKYRDKVLREIVTR